MVIHPMPDGSTRFEGGPKGNRSVSNFREIVWECDALQARSVWANGTYTENAGVTEVEVRAMFETREKALIFMRYLARVDLSIAMDGPSAVAGFCAGTFETSAEQFGWLNRTQMVGSARYDHSIPTMTYDVHVLEATD